MHWVPQSFSLVVDHVVDVRVSVGDEGHDADRRGHGHRAAVDPGVRLEDGTAVQGLHRSEVVLHPDLVLGHLAELPQLPGGDVKGPLKSEIVLVFSFPVSIFFLEIALTNLEHGPGDDLVAPGGGEGAVVPVEALRAGREDVLEGEAVDLGLVPLVRDLGEPLDDGLKLGVVLGLELQHDAQHGQRVDGAVAAADGAAQVGAVLLVVVHQMKFHREGVLQSERVR